MEITPEMIAQFRLFAGSDCDATTDEDISLFIMAGGSVTRGLALLYTRYAGEAALRAKQVKDYDLQVATEKRAEYLMGMSRLWEEKAAKDDVLSGDADIFDVFGPTGIDLPREAAPRPVTF